MIAISTVGGVTAEVELKESNKKVPYLSFDLAVTKGYGNGKHTVYLQCWAFNSIAERMVAANVKKGSQIFVSGDFDVTDFERKDGTKGKANKVIIQDWKFVGSSKSENSSSSEKKSNSIPDCDEIECNNEDGDLPL